ncbi:MAG: sulfatase-like hydrolase/transferase [Planctomycetota bacterium]|nr:sulfatase-like hydrolase/transferase [Planctomycetota bacterium]
MRDRIILLSKDVLRSDYLPVYGNTYWKTPNIDELASRGTVFRRHYASAPSTGMGFTCMFSGLNAHELDRRSYKVVNRFEQTPTLFDILQERGYCCHVIWNSNFWDKIGYPYSKCYGDNTVFHNLTIGQLVGPHKIDTAALPEGRGLKTIETITDEVDKIKADKLFLWIHAPHVFHGRSSYGSDIDLFDGLVGEMRKRFGDESVYVTADHGHMNCEKGVPVYGFHVYEGAIRIPLITPRIENMPEVMHPTSNIQLKDIILTNTVAKPDCVISDTQYYAQPKRKVAIIKDNYKYIYNKSDRTEELYDCLWDEKENVNLLLGRWYDSDRHRWYFTEEISFYPFYDRAREYYRLLKAKKDEIWREGGFVEEWLYLLNNKYKGIMARLKNIGKGRYCGHFGSA